MVRIVLLLALSSAVLASDVRPDALTFCHEDQNSFPWVLKDRPGLNILLIRLVERDMHLPIKFVSMPWKRCLAELAANHVDGAFAASFKTDRLEMGQYPPGKDGKPDPAARLHMSRYSLYRGKGGDLGWDGQNFGNLRGAIGSLSGFSIAEFLKAKGATVDEGTKSPEGTLRKVAMGRLQGAALQTPRAERVLQQFPDLADSIEHLPIPLEERPYYLMLSFKLVKQAPVLADSIWRNLTRVRESLEYRRIEQEFYSDSGGGSVGRIDE